jgi:hypothetical protein
MEGITLPDVLGHLQLQYQDGVPARRQQKVWYNYPGRGIKYKIIISVNGNYDNNYLVGSTIISCPNNCF